MSDHWSGLDETMRGYINNQLLSHWTCVFISLGHLWKNITNS